MGQSRLTLVAGVLVALALLLGLVVYEVDETELAVVLTFGKATRKVEEAGPGLKWPWPIQTVRSFDRRQRILHGPFEQGLTGDQRSVLLASFLLWRIDDPQVFLDRVGDPAAAERRLRDLLRSAQSSALGQVRFENLVSTDPAALSYEAVERAMQARIEQALAGEPLGVKVETVGIRRLGLPKDVTEAVFQRMREERNTSAEKLLAEGATIAGRIKAEAEAEKERKIAQAAARAEAVLAEAEQERAEAFREIEADAELYVFVQKLRALKRLLDGRTTLVFDPTQPPFDLLAALNRAAEGERR